MADRIYALKNGPISVTIEANKKFMVLFSRKRQNEVIRNSLNMAGEFWANIFLPKRFTNYARTALRYNPSIAWETAKRQLTDSQNDAKRALAPQPMPLVYRGDMRKSALSRWRLASVATAKKQVLTVRIPLGHAVRKHIAETVTFVPRLELQRIVEVFSKVMAQQVANAYGPQVAAPRPSGVVAGRKAA